MFHPVKKERNNFCLLFTFLSMWCNNKVLEMKKTFLDFLVNKHRWWQERPTLRRCSLPPSETCIHRFRWSGTKRIDTIDGRETILAVFDTQRLHSIDWVQIKPHKAFVWEKFHWDAVEPPEVLKTAGLQKTFMLLLCCFVFRCEKQCSINQRHGKQNCPAERLIYPPPCILPPRV